jgi:phage gp46-like protein
MPDASVSAACASDLYLLWDLRWLPGASCADYRLAAPDEAGNVGGLSATAAIETAVNLCLFTDRRLPDGHPLSYLADDGNPRGWWGDGIDVREQDGEAPLGSLLWLLERAPLTIAGMPATRWAEAFAGEALAPLIAQGVAVRIDISAAADEIANRLELTVALYGRVGAMIFDRKYDVLWNQVAR